MKFREHRGSLEESMATVVELDQFYGSLYGHVKKILMAINPSLHDLDINRVKLSYNGDDPRVAWDEVWIVSVEDMGVVGMTDRLPTNTPGTSIIFDKSVRDNHAVQATLMTPGLRELAEKHEFRAGDVTRIGDAQKKHYLVNGGDVPFDALKHDAVDGALSAARLGAALSEEVHDQHPVATRVPQHDDSLESLVSSVESGAVPVVQHDAITGAQWFKELRDLVANEDNDKALVLIDSLSMSTFQTIQPPVKVEPGQGAAAFAKLEDWAKDLGHPDFQSWVDSIPPHIASQWKQADAGMVIVPDAEHMTEAMVDASRGLHLYYVEAGIGVRSDHMRKHLDRYAPWAKKHYPQWFREDTGHLTKAGRAQIAHALTIGAYFDPDAREEYFKETREVKGRVWDNPFHQRVRLTFKPLVMGELFEDGGFVIYKRFMDNHQVGENKYLITLNRSDLPKEHRKKFKQTAVAVFLSLENEGREVVFGEVLVYPKLESSTFQVTPMMASRF